VLRASTQKGAGGLPKRKGKGQIKWGGWVSDEGTDKEGQRRPVVQGGVDGPDPWRREPSRSPTRAAERIRGNARWKRGAVSLTQSYN